MKLSAEDATLAANTLRMLAVDAVENARSGHPGMPMGAADMAFALWHDHLRFHPTDPEWPGRDRFILSAGHGSMLLYGLLHLFGYSLTINDLAQFRQWGSLTPGHPEWGVTSGVEVTTGPLGQGFANGVGMALAAKMAASRFADDEIDLLDHYVYALISDGDLMEGISHEAASLAGHHHLGNLIYLYDNNGITIEGSTDLAFSDDTAKRFEAYHWHVQTVDGHSYQDVSEAISAAKDEKNRPSLIIAATHIAHGSPGKHDSASAHGSPLGPDEAKATRDNLQWPEQVFHVPEKVRAMCQEKLADLANHHNQWQQEYSRWRDRNPEKAMLWDAMWNKTVPESLAQNLLDTITGEDGATRSLSGKILQKAALLVPSLVGGSADLEPSTNTWIKGSGEVNAPTHEGRNLRFGVREHAMAATMNGMARYGSFIPYGATFLVFSDYCRPAIRLAALMKQQVIYIFTHDSLFVGEDGPTHQPVEHVASLRLIPDLAVIRPADGAETAMAWAVALKRKEGPTALILSRQHLPLLRHEGGQLGHMSQGGYVLASGGDLPNVVLLASGSEVSLAQTAALHLKEQGIICRILSVPWLEQFLMQPPSYLQQLMPEGIPRVALEAGRGMPWYRLLRAQDLFIGMETFGASAPEKVLAERFGLSPHQVSTRISEYLTRL
jgi:transketolase